MLLRLVRFVLGVVLGLGLWVATASQYNALVARGTETLLRLDSRFAGAEVTAHDPAGGAAHLQSNQLNNWSEEHFSVGAAGAWRVAEMFYRLVGMFGAVFVCWWLASQVQLGTTPTRRTKRLQRAR